LLAEKAGFPAFFFGKTGALRLERARYSDKNVSFESRASDENVIQRLNDALCPAQN
jgi:hypothetical protein